MDEGKEGAGRKYEWSQIAPQVVPTDWIRQAQASVGAKAAAHVILAGDYAYRACHGFYCTLERYYFISRSSRKRTLTDSDSNESKRKRMITANVAPSLKEM